MIFLTCLAATHSKHDHFVWMSNHLKMNLDHLAQRIHDERASKYYESNYYCGVRFPTINRR